MPLLFLKKVFVSKFNLAKFDGAQKVWRKEGEAFKLIQKHLKSCIRRTVKFVWSQYYGVGIDDLEWNKKA